MKLTFKKKLITITCLFILGLVCLSFTPSIALGDEGLKTTPFLPLTYSEYYALSSPIDTAFNNGELAILENDGGQNKSIITYSNGTYTKHSSTEYNFGDINQIKYFGDKLILQDRFRPYLFDYKNGVYTEIKDDKGADIPCKYFDFNSNYFIALESNTISVYNLVNDNGTPVLSKVTLSITTNTDSCVAINDNNKIFYFNEGNLCINNANALSSEPETHTFSSYVLSSACKSVIADNDKLYFSHSAGLGYFDLSSKQTVNLVSVGTSKNLGSLFSPRGISLRNGKICVADVGINAITEFDLNGDYSGYAITTTAKGYNRLDGVIKGDIYFSNGKLAFFDGEKLSVTDKQGKDYKNFYFEQDLNVFTPSNLSFNGETVLFANNLDIVFFNTTTGEVKNLNTTDSAFAHLNPYATCYSNGYFYVLANPNGSKNYVLQIDEKTLTPTVILQRETIARGDLIAVDVDGYLYVYSNGKVFKYENQGETRGQIESYDFTTNPLSINVDLFGTAYLLYGDNTVEYYKNGEKVQKSIDSTPYTNAKVTGFAMDYSSKEVYFIFANDGLILSTTDLSNGNTDSVKVPTDFKLTDTNAQNIENLKIIQVENLSNLYLIEKGENENFIYKGITRSNGETYLLVDETEQFYVLTDDGEDGNNGLVLAKKEHGDIQTITTDSSVDFAYVTTKVHLYYLPLVTDGYKLLDTERLPKNTAVTISDKVTFRGAEFYLATATVDGVTAKGYLPKEFVTTTISGELSTQTYSYKTLKAGTVVYTDNSMVNKLYTTTANTTTKAYKVNEKTYIVEFTVSDTVYYGYVYAENFAINGEHAVRNAIIIVIVATSALITSLFFIHRKKKLF